MAYPAPCARLAGGHRTERRPREGTPLRAQTRPETPPWAAAPRPAWNTQQPPQRRRIEAEADTVSGTPEQPSEDSCLGTWPDTFQQRVDEAAFASRTLASSTLRPEPAGIQFLRTAVADEWKLFPGPGIIRPGMGIPRPIP